MKNSFNDFFMKIVFIFLDPGDMILQVNDISFDNMSNDDAVKVLKDVVQKPGPIRLVVAKSWDPSPSSQGGRGGGLSLPRSDPVRPIDPGAWVAHTAAVRGKIFYCNFCSSSSFCDLFCFC